MTDETQLLEMPKSSKASVRYEACELLRVQDVISLTALSALKAALDDPDRLVRELAAIALHVHELDDQWNEAIIVEEEIPSISPDELPLPAGLNVVKEVNDLRFDYKLPAEIWALAWAGVVIMLLIGWWYAFRVHIMFLTVLSLCLGIYMIYVALALMVNRAIFQVSLNELSFQFTPIPLIPSRQVPTNDLLQLGIEEKRYSAFSFGQSREVPTNDLSLLSLEEKVVSPLKMFHFFERKLYYLYAVLKDGRRVRLTDPKLGAGSPFPYDVLNYIVVHTHRRLGIMEKRVVKVAKTNGSEIKPE